MMDHFARTDSTDLDKQRLRRAFFLALIPAVLLAARMAESAEVVLTQPNAESWTIDIQPLRTPVQLALQDQAQGAGPILEESAPAPAAPAPQITSEPVNEAGVEVIPNGKFTLNGLTYLQVYNAIPFSRTEYLANPSYRHDATMELWTGVPRQTVINRTYEPKLNTPIEPQLEFLYNRYGTFGGTFGPSAGYGYGFGYGYIPTYAPAFRYFLPIDYGL